MSATFRELLKKIGSGTHTGDNLTREEATLATRLMLQQEATPAQIGAFAIAHRIKRPIPEELAGMLDAYDELGPKIPALSDAHDYPVTVIGVPYDGRSRTTPVTAITAVILATAGVPVLLHGGDVMPTKYGLPLVKIWQQLGMDFTTLEVEQIHQVMDQTGLGFLYLPKHFPLAHNLVPYREQIGKRPPLATIELIWFPYAGAGNAIAGFVHPPTEGYFRETYQLRQATHPQIHRLTTVKGLEGSIDLARNRTAIIGICQSDGDPSWRRLNVYPRECGVSGSDVSFDSPWSALQLIEATLHGEPTPLVPAAIYNSGFYLWHCGVCADLASGVEQAKDMLAVGKVADQQQQIAQAIAAQRKK
ncbi:anthranilate phosphoribosyltransferase family protein [Geitlerinema sp. PCC 9228]|uniref:anthranilate phosphoribosyltransferase family protein n=1 Tax=Geitlerinema sp. PCC 9228 TaxID=111611 RepID=UPI0008F9A2ED|nr:anthranilate phosphoribosyltransferase family protein [Geitlerinema sp. PCC 9228]